MSDETSDIGTDISDGGPPGVHPPDNKFRFCCYCGAKLQVKAPPHE